MTFLEIYLGILVLGIQTKMYQKKKKDLKLRKYIINKIKEKKPNKKNLQKTHIDFNNKILNLLKDKDLKNFLRKKTSFKKCFFYKIDFLYTKNLKR